MVLYIDGQCDDCDAPLELRLVARMLLADGSRIREYSGLCQYCGLLTSRRQQEVADAQPQG